MIHSYRFEIKFVFLIFCVSFLLFSCASTPKTEVNFGTKAVYSDEDTKISINKSKKAKKKYTYFSRIDENVMHEVENGSPNSLRKAASMLRKTEKDYEDNEKVLLDVNANIMKIAWPSERIDWETPEIQIDTPYMGAINSARKGIYDLSTGNVDFLTTVLPSLVVLVVDDVKPFFSMSEAALKKGISMYPDSVLANYLLGQLYKKNGDIEKAFECFSKIVKFAPNCFEVLYAYGESLVSVGKSQEAFQFLIDLLKKYPSNVEVLKLLAKVSYSLENYDLAEDYIARVLQQVPNDLNSLLFRAEILVAKQDYIHAASLLDVYARQDSNSKNYLLLRAKLQYDWSKNLSAAISTIEQALKLYPNDENILLFAAKLCSEANVLVNGKTVDYYANAVLNMNPSSEQALKYAVEGFVQNKQWKNAYDLSRMLISKKNASMDTIFKHINICISLKKIEEAENLILPLYKSNPNDESIIQSYIVVLIEQGKKTAALDLINSLLQTSSSKLKSFLYYKRSFLQSSVESSLSDLRSSLISNPRNTDALFRLYQIYYDKKDYRKAQYYLKQVVALNPNDSELKNLNEQLNLLIK